MPAPNKDILIETLMRHATRYFILITTVALEMLQGWIRASTNTKARSPAGTILFTCTKFQSQVSIKIDKCFANNCHTIHNRILWFIKKWRCYFYLRPDELHSLSTCHLWTSPHFVCGFLRRSWLGSVHKGIFFFWNECITGRLFVTHESHLWIAWHWFVNFDTNLNPY